MAEDDQTGNPGDASEEWPGAGAHDELDEFEHTSFMGQPLPELSEEEEDRRARETLEELAIDAHIAREAWRQFAEENTPPRPDWLGLANNLRDARVRLGISKREAAKRANLSEGAWRHLEKGMKLVGGSMVRPNPRNENLVGVARAVNLEPAIVFFYAGRPLPEGLAVGPSPDEMLEKLRQLSAEDRDLVGGVIDRLLR